MGWFKIENSDLIISDSVLDSTARYLTLIFEEFDLSKFIPDVHTLISLVEDLLSQNPQLAPPEISENRRYANFLPNQATSQLSDQMKVRMEKHLQDNIAEIIRDYQNDLERMPTKREILAVLMVSLNAFSEKLTDSNHLSILLNEIKVRSLIL